MRGAIPPAGYVAPKFPALNVRTLVDPSPEKKHTLFFISDVWRFTVLWTLVVYAVFHLSAVLIAIAMHGRKKSSWKYIWVIPIVYLVWAGVEAVVSGTIVGLLLGAVYRAGYYEMNTWIPCTWAFVNVFILVISSFSMQGGL